MLLPMVILLILDSTVNAPEEIPAVQVVNLDSLQQVKSNLDSLYLPVE